ncbi:hypothetical protein FJZ31_09050 [Candidatus Poribacteria bacterium]|nr:hypothetical protein [Candidatus Poribacteria bacterium]
MIESFAYEIIKREGREEGLVEGVQKGLQQGLQRGMLDEAKELVLEALSVRFQNVPARLSYAVRKTEDREKLKALHRQAILCSSLSKFEEILTDI